MVHIKVLASRSDGNAYQIYDGDKHIIIDPGLTPTEISKRSNYTIADADFCLASHEHRDHAGSLGYIGGLGVTIAASKGTLDKLNIENCDFRILTSLKPFHLADWSVLPFDIEHDADEPMGFMIQTPSKKRILFATDTCYVKYRFKKINYYMIECNYSRDLLLLNNRPENVNRRVIASHFELQDVKKFFSIQDLSYTEEIYLLHMSKDNSDPERFVNEIMAITGLPTFDASDL